MHFIDKEEKVDAIISEVNQLPLIEALLDKIWNQYMNAYEKEEEIFLEACYQGDINLIKKVTSNKNKHPIDPRAALTD